jgi:large repetitive protein
MRRRRLAFGSLLAPALAGIVLSLTACGDNRNPTGPDGATVDAAVIDTPSGDAAIDAPTDAPPAGATCTVTAGGATKLLTGTVLTPTGPLANGQVAINAAGMITCVGAACAAGGETRIDCPMGVISPGLINTHDHITFTQNAPYNDTGERYEHRHDWRNGQRGHTEINTPGNASADQIRWGELRFLLGGATSIVGSGGQAGILRNLDSAANQEGLGQAAVRFETFPLDDTGGAQRTMDCNYGAAPDTAMTIAALSSYEPHIAEGIDRVSRNEFQCTSSTTYDTTLPGVSNDLMAPQTAIIHGVGLTPFDYGLMAGEGTALIWSPRSNVTLYGDTAQVTVASRMGVEIALGTDWSATGSMNLLRELRCAADLNRVYYNGYFTDEQLWKMVTINAAAVTATDDVIGSIAVGKVADLTIFDGRTNPGYKAVLQAEPKDVWLVLRGGKPLYGVDTVIAALTPTGCDALDVCGQPKRVCLMGEVGKTYDALKTGAGAATYPAFFCGAPTNEPSCTPKRPAAVAGSTIYTGVVGANDSDGDGIANAMDNCPTVFNPIRPVDGGAQGNFDNDNLGDVCDPCPVNANTTTCTVVNPDDRDGDGVLNVTDNCPDNANANQADADMDMKGDVCDACPMAANPGVQGCPTTIYKIKDRMGAMAVPLGQVVSVTNALVTGKGSNGFFVQVKSTLTNGMPDPAYVSANFSGLFVFTGAASPFLTAVTVGNRVTVTGTVTDFFGQTELDGVSDVTVTSMMVEAPPAPVMATAAEVTTGGTRAAALEGVVVRTGGAAITAVNAAAGEFTVMEPGGGSLVVDDFLFVQPMPMVNQTFASLTGILAFRNSASKLEPRSAADLPTGAPILVSFAPAQTFVNEGQLAAPTVPTPLTVTLSGPAVADTTVMITSGTPAALTVVGGGVTVLAGQTSGTVLVNGLAQNAGVTLTATLGAVSLTASVRVIGPAEVPSVVTLTPPMATVAPGGMVTLTATIDLPAPVGGTAIGLALLPVNAGMIPATVTVPAGQRTVTFAYVDGSVAMSAMVTASLAASTSSTMITISAATQHLVINEVDYDQSVNPDGTEFVEIFNPTAAPISLVGKAVVLLNGSTTPASEYRRVLLATAGNPAGTLPAGGYLVIGAAAVTPMGAGIKFTPAVGDWPATDAFQNGAPDAIALIDVGASTVIDALAYEGSTPMLMGTITGFPAAVNLVEGTFLPTLTADSGTVMGSLCRLPNGTDTDNAATDWNVTTTATPGIANVP